MTAHFFPSGSRRKRSPNRNSRKWQTKHYTPFIALPKARRNTLGNFKKFPSEEFTLPISLALAERFNIQSEHTREKHIWNSSVKIKQGKQNGVGGGKKHGVIRNTDLHSKLSLCNGTGFAIQFIFTIYKYCCPGKRLNDSIITWGYCTHSGTFA